MSWIMNDPESELEWLEKAHWRFIRTAGDVINLLLEWSRLPKEKIEAKLIVIIENFSDITTMIRAIESIFHNNGKGDNR